jgi:hypothetical protein
MLKKKFDKGIIVNNNNYTYDGTILNKQAHGNGLFVFENGDRYLGECQFNRLDGYGVYTFKNLETYTGYFSFGFFHGLGTFEDNEKIVKGTWRYDLMHGIFHRTDKKLNCTYLEKWNKNKLIYAQKIQYMQPNTLKTVKHNPNKSQKKLQILFKANGKKCMACCDNFAHATSITCGHVCMCYDCLAKCDKCPICRCPITSIIKLYIS